MFLLMEFELQRPRQSGDCWLALDLWQQLQLDGFWHKRLPASRKKTSWQHVLTTLAFYRLIEPGSEWRCTGIGITAAPWGIFWAKTLPGGEHQLYRCLDLFLRTRRRSSPISQERWKTLFDVRFDVLLYDLTSTYFECDPPREVKRGMATAATSGRTACKW